MNSYGQTDDKFIIVKTERGRYILEYGGYKYTYYSHSDKKKTITWLCNKNRRSRCNAKIVSKGVKFEKFKELTAEFKELTNDEFKKLKIDIEFINEHTCVKNEIINEKPALGKTREGNPKLVLGDYEYYFDGTGKNGNIYWACNKKNCKGRVINEGNKYILTQEHEEQYHIEGEAALPGNSSSRGGRKRRGQAEATQQGELGFDLQEIQQAIVQSAEEYQRGRGRTRGVIIGGGSSRRRGRQRRGSNLGLGDKGKRPAQD
uniref:FLYWCH-type domain-containing protein n=1 Tax=Meloidogyne javanica TaxID=6303 RepID=A0A915NEV3_MELJA